MVRKATILLLVVTAAGLRAGAVPEDFALRLELTQVGGTEVLVVGDWKVDKVQGWSYGVRNDPAKSSIGGCDKVFMNDCGHTDCAAVACTAEMELPNPTGPAGLQKCQFNSVNVYKDGVTQGVVTDMMIRWTFPIKTRFEMLRVNYTLIGGATSDDLSFSSTLGDPTIDTVYVHEGLSIPPAVQQGVKIGQAGQGCPTLNLKLEYGAPAVTGADCQQTADVPVLLTTGEGDFASGFQLGATLNTTDAKIQSVAEGAAIKAAMAPDPVEYFKVELIDNGKSVVVGCVLELTPNNPQDPVFRTLPECGAKQEVAVVKVVPNAQKDVSARLTFQNGLGTPPKDIGVDVDGTTLIPELGGAASFNFTCPVVKEPFVRGDTNQDGVLNVSDAVAIAKAVFGVGSKLTLIENCWDSADANDNGTVDTSDAIYLLRYLFEGGARIPAPNTCGNDTTGDALSCPSYPPCPR